MAELKLDGTEIPVAPGGHRVRFEALAPSTRAGNGELRSATISERPKVPVWEIETPPLTGSEDTAVLGELTTSGSVTADGDLIGIWSLDGTLVAAGLTVYVRGVRRRTEGPSPDWVTSFELLGGDRYTAEDVTTLITVDDGNGFATLSDSGTADFEWEDDGNGFAAASDSATGTTFTAYETSGGVTFIDG